MDNKLTTYSASLLRFISSFDVDPDNTVIATGLDKAEFISRFYTPQMRVSTLAMKVLKELETNNVVAQNRNLDKDSFMYKLQNSDLRTSKPYLYQLSKTIMLECFSLVYAVQDSPKLLKYTNKEDIYTARTNLKYLLDSIGEDNKYSAMKEDIGKLDIALGYLQAQVPVLKEVGANNG